MRSPLGTLLILVTVIWCLADVAAPLFQLAPVYYFFSTLCHQLPTRSWHIHGEPLGLCIRCTSISFGFLAGLLLHQKPNTRRFKMAVAISAIEWLFAVAIFDSEVLRVLSGVFLGFAAAPIVQIGVEELFIRMRTAHEPM